MAQPTDFDIIRAAAKAAAQDILDCDGNQVAGILAGAGGVGAGGQGRNLAQDVAGCLVDIPAAGGRLMLGEMAVVWGRLGAIEALAKAASDELLARMARRAARNGGPDELRAVLTGGRSDLQTHHWREAALVDAVANHRVFRMLLEMPAARAAGPYGAFFWSGEGCVNAAIAMAGSADPQALWDMAREIAPGMAEDIAKVTGKGHVGGKTPGTVFWSGLGKHCAERGVTDTLLDFLATRVCRDARDRWRLALVVVSHGSDTGQLGRLCQRNEAMAEAVGEACGTAGGVRRAVNTLRLRKRDVGQAGNDEVLAWVRALAALGRRTPALRRGRQDDDWTWRFCAGWLAARSADRLASGPASGRARLRA